MIRKLKSGQYRLYSRKIVKRRRRIDQDLECTPASGQGQAADLTICRACSCSNLMGLR